MDFSRFKTFIFDLDGTVWNWKELFPGVKRFVSSLKRKGKQVLFITNNTKVRRRELAKRLRGFGIDADEDDVVSSSLVIAEYLKNKKGSALVLGDGLREDLREAGIKISDDSHVKYLVVGQDTKFNYGVLALALNALRNGAAFLTSARGRFFVYGDNLLPSTGVLVEAIEYASGRKAILLGKPSDFMCQAVQLFVQSPRKETVVFGDELKADVGLGKKCGYSTVLVRTGIDRNVKGRIRPDAVLNSFADLKF